MGGDVIPLGARLRQRREELGLTQAQAARELDVARTAYRLWEMEAARPAPDRWRTIASWLGITVTAMLLAGELLDESEAVDAERAVRGSGLPNRAWDDQSGASEGDFFSQERMTIASQAAAGGISPEQASRLHAVLARLQAATGEGGAPRWHPGHFRKRMPNSDLAPMAARAALTATALGIPAPVLEDATLLISELVTNSVKHTSGEWIEVVVAVDATRLRVDVTDPSTKPIRPRTPDADGGWGLTLVAALAHRWGVERRADGKTVWVELDLTG